MIITCKDCKRRYIGCHDRCETYHDFKQSIKKPSREGEVDYNIYRESSGKRMKRTGGIRRKILC